MKTRGMIKAVVIIGALALLLGKQGLADDELPLIDCQQTICKITSYDYDYIPTSETSNVSVRRIKGYTEERATKGYDANGNAVANLSQTTTRVMNENFLSKSFLFTRSAMGPLIEKVNRNEKTSGESLMYKTPGSNMEIQETYYKEGENIGKLSRVKINSSFEERFGDLIQVMTISEEFSDFTYYLDGNISGYIESHIEAPDLLIKISDIKYDENGKIIGMVRIMGDRYGNTMTWVERNIKYNNFGDRVYWEEIQYNNYPPKPPVVRKETSLSCKITQLEGGPVDLRRISGMLFTGYIGYPGDGIAGIADKKIIITIDGPEDSTGMFHSTILTTETDMSGNYQVTFDTKNIPGKYKVTAQFTGDDEYLPSSAGASFFVNKVVKTPTALTCEITTTEYSTPEYVHYKFSGRLIENVPHVMVYPIPSAKGIPGRIIKIKVEIEGKDSKINIREIGQNTDAGGTYRITLPVYTINGEHLKGATAEFEGDEQYGSSSAVGQFIKDEPIYPIKNPIVIEPPDFVIMPMPEMPSFEKTVAPAPQTKSAGVFVVNNEQEGLTTETHKDWFWFKK